MPSYRTIISALSVGQILVWAVMYYGFPSFVLPIQRDTGWSQPDTMGAFTLGPAVWGLATYSVGAAIDRGKGRAVLSGGALLGAAGCARWSQAYNLPVLHAAWAMLGLAMAMTLYEPALCTRAAAPFLAAWVLLGLGGYTGLIWLLGGMGAVSLLFFASARPPQQGRSR